MRSGHELPPSAKKSRRRLARRIIFSSDRLTVHEPPTLIHTENTQMSASGNLFADLPTDFPNEVVTRLVEAGNIRIERIVSLGHASPDGFWYDQDQAEWVLLLRGAALLQFDDDVKPVQLKPGDFVDIAAHRRHRVTWTAPDEPTVWLAVHYG